MNVGDLIERIERLKDAGENLDRNSVEKDGHFEVPSAEYAKFVQALNGAYAEKTLGPRWQPRKSILCLLSAHDFVRIGPVEPLETSEAEQHRRFSSNGYMGHFALGKCQRCGREQFIQVHGSFQWSGIDEMTELDYYKEHRRYRLEMLVNHGFLDKLPEDEE